MAEGKAATRRRVVVVGASLAGLRSAEALRKAGYCDELVVVGGEPYLPYNRPPLSKEPVGQPIAPEWLRPNRLATDILWRLGQPVTAVDLDARTVKFGTGQAIEWTGLVIATGLRPRRLTLPGPESGRFALRTLEDANRLRFALKGARSLVIIGAGFIGCELAALAATNGISTHVVAPEAVPIERPLGLLLGAEIRRRLEALGVHFHLGNLPSEFCGEDAVQGVVLADGTRLAADVVVEAIGSDPNIEWLSGNGLDLLNGVLCDGAMRVEGRPDVVACGDIARFPNPRFDDVPRRVEHWMTTIDTAKRAGQALASYLGGEAGPGDTFAPVPSFWSDQHNIRIQSFGSPELGAEDVRVLEGEIDGDVAVGYHRSGELVGVVLLGLQARFMAYRHEIEALGKQVIGG